MPPAAQGHLDLSANVTSASESSGDTMQIVTLIKLLKTPKLLRIGARRAARARRGPDAATTLHVPAAACRRLRPPLP